MALLLYRLGRFSFRHKWWVIAAWVALLVVVFGLVGIFNPKFSKDFELPGTDGGKAMTVIKQEFPANNEKSRESSTSVVVFAQDGLANHRSELDGLVRDLQNMPSYQNELKDAKKKVADAKNPADRAAAEADLTKINSYIYGAPSGETGVASPLAHPNDAAVMSQSGENKGKVGLIEVNQVTHPEDLKIGAQNDLKDVLKKHRVGGLQVEATGALMQVQQQGASEAIGFIAGFVVMIVAFGALIAAFIPIITAIVGVMLSMQLVTLGAGIFNMNESATGIIMMLGIAVSIDYALFIVSRYRSELNVDPDRESAAGRAVGTAGTAVCFAGLTVIIAVVALNVVGIPFVGQMGGGAGVAVLIAVLGALTLIPALLGAFGRFAFKPRVKGLRHGDEPEEMESNGHRFIIAITKGRRPLPIAIAFLILLAIVAIPIGSLKLGMDFTSDAERPAIALMQKGFGEGANGGELYVTVQAKEAGDVKAAAGKAIGFIDSTNSSGTTYVAGAPAVAAVNGNTALLLVVPQQSPSSTATHDLVEKIRDYAKESAVKDAGTEIHVGGQTAIMSDISAKLSSALIPYLILVIGLAFIIMMIIFRSILVPLTATLGFVFSVAATFGATVAIFQEGHLGIISHPQSIISFLPIFLIGVVFGLAIDYQVFLVTRMREEYVHGMTAREAVISGYKHGARVVASAAVIMICVFAAFMLSPETVSKMMGFSLAAAVFFDAFIVRMIVVPAVIAVMGDRAWWIPKWLDKILPNVDIEGEAIRRIPLPSQQQDPRSDAYQSAKS
ncbi:MMPL family transporter [Jongsikchunia kroppenstedtii]|uniref:MMPL family transporter n=1 Tax=Jongsikchunia kroppenstedtii TaxID=1121721 RepID=UPI000476CF15|nr:MMPL family transporter [Jongsikchunia kroppenstedtii]